MSTNGFFRLIVISDVSSPKASQMFRDRKSMGLLFLYGYLYNLLDDSWRHGNYCWFAFALWSGCCSASFQYFVIDHLVIATVQNTTKLPPIYWIRHLPGKGRIFVFSNRSESGTLLKTHICYVSILSLD